MKIPGFSLASLASLSQRPGGATPSKTNATAAGKTDGAETPAKSDREARKLQAAKDAVAALKAMPRDNREAEKARAAEKVKELKARLQALKMIYAGDPKKLARIAAQMARELAAAVKSYVDAGGSADAAGAAGGSDVGAGAGASANAQPGAAKDAAGATGAAQAEGATGATATAATGGADAKDADAKEADAKNTDAKGEHAATGGAQATTLKLREDPDAEFKREASTLARELKAALRRRDPRDRDEHDHRSAEAALGSVDQAVGALPLAAMTAAATGGGAGARTAPGAACRRARHAPPADRGSHDGSVRAGRSTSAGRTSAHGGGFPPRPRSAIAGRRSPRR